WQIDKALMYGVIRQESRFKPKAKSYVGASGLMQLMPATASFVEQDRSLRRKNKSKLQDPEYNLSIGQKYIQFLTRLLGEKKDLIRLLSAYNTGPKTVLDFDKKIEKHGEDPLLYLECFPAKETRSYVKNVLMNVWMYQLRFDEESESLQQLSEDNWPLYE
ncbi:MAG: lytic transglycosylase domain-containing protein, partial [Alphaproteobacteria bacterium]|nr:lytic transglycosylase domain-containing protein [Alphaproteobacteria bacterium]